MKGKLINSKDTIATISSPPGRGAVGIIRISGNKVLEILTKDNFRFKTKEKIKPKKQYLVKIYDNKGCFLDEAIFCYNRKKESYTNEDLLELYCHGSPYILEAVLQELFELGIRAAKPGEFTERAYLNGKIDLTKAEAINDLVNAYSQETLHIAAGLYSGKLKQILIDIQMQIVDALSRVETSIDFTTEDIEFDDKNEIKSRVIRIINTISPLLASYSSGQIYKDGIQVAIIGKPNVGKSSLLNAFVGRDRSIVTDSPGTTRDFIEESCIFDGIRIKFVDTAGLREGGDSVERLGIERTMEKIAESNLVMFVLDSSRDYGKEDVDIYNLISKKNHLSVLNKTDLISCANYNSWAFFGPIEKVSAIKNKGIFEIKEKIVKQFKKVDFSANYLIISNSRHHKLLSSLKNCLETCIKNLSDNKPFEIIAVDLRDGLDCLGEIIGEKTNEDVLENIFSNFCIGK